VRTPITLVALLAAVAGSAQPAAAQDEPSCRFICELEFKVEPTFTIEPLNSGQRILTSSGLIERVEREAIFETVLALDFGTRVPRLGFSAEMITSPTHDDNEVQLEFETNLYWLTEKMSRGWVTSHFDIVDQLSPAERPNDKRSYTHKLDFELDTAFHLFKKLPEGRWLRGLELEGSLDYLATGLPKAADVFADGSSYLDDASHWSFSFVIVIPIAPF